MAFGAFVLQKDYIAYSVRSTMNPHAPVQTCRRQFKKGDIIKGELKHLNNQPAIVISRGGWIFPVDRVKEVIAKEVASDADGGSGEKKNPVEQAISKAKSPKVAFMDAILIGGFVGLAAGWFAEKRGWIASNPVSPYKNKLIFAAVASAIAAYAVYRVRENKKAADKQKNKQ